jgi:hypothetical protein
VSDGLTLSALRKLADRLRSPPPIIYELWFVDRLRDYARYRAVIGYGVRIDVPRAVAWYAWCDHGEPRPAFCTTPGIWARLTDGTDREFSATDLDALIQVVPGVATSTELYDQLRKEAPCPAN